MLTGPDCSRHQGYVDWTAVARAGHSFAIIKATEGTSYAYTGWYRANAPRVVSAGLTLGAYHFLRTSDPGAQARYFVDTVGDFKNVIAVVDVETAANGSKPQIHHVRSFADSFHALVPGHPLLVYTGRWYWVGHMGDPHGADIGPLWHSEYETTQAEVNDGPEGANYGGWNGATIWQWTSSGSCPGVAGRCDLNIFYGTHDDLAVLAGAKLGGGPIPKSPTKEEDDMPWIHSSEWTGQHFVDGDTATWLDSPAEVDNLVRQGSKVWTFVTESNARRVLEERANIRDDLARTEMRVEGIREAELREEQRDLNDEA